MFKGKVSTFFLIFLKNILATTVITFFLFNIAISPSFLHISNYSNYKSHKIVIGKLPNIQTPKELDDNWSKSVRTNEKLQIFVSQGQPGALKQNKISIVKELERNNTTGSTVGRLWEITRERPERAEEEEQTDGKKSRKTRERGGRRKKGRRETKVRKWKRRREKERRHISLPSDFPLFLSPLLSLGTNSVS